MERAGPPYRFGAFRLDVDRRLLERAGAPVTLGPRGFDILRMLVEQRERVLSRAEILASVWSGLSVEEHNLSVQISKLRRALGDTGEEGQVIATIPGRGYQFVALLEAPELPVAIEPAEAAPAAPAAPAARSRIVAGRGVVLGSACLLLAAAGAWAVLRRPPPLAPPLSIVVMPLRDLSDRPGQAYLADAIGDDLTTELAQLPGSTVIARETADSYKGRAVPVGEVGRILHVRYLLEGSVRAEDASLHINAQLIDVATGGHLWAQRFDVTRTSLEDTREIIVHRIASALDVELVAAASAHSQQDRPDDPSALDLFFKARSILDHDDSLKGFDTAQALLEQSVARQPGFGDALAELGSMLLRKIQSVDDPTDQADYAEAKAMIARALAVSPRNARALGARGQALVIEGHYAGAAYAARAALAGDASNLAALGVLAKSAFNQGQLEEAAQALQALLRINPGSLSERPRLLLLGNVRLLEGRDDEAIDLLERSVAGDPEPRPGVDSWGRAEGARTLLIAAHALRGDLARARDLYRDYDRVWPHRSVWRIAATASRPLAALPGFARLLAALRQSGMPEFASERADDGIAPSHTPLRGEIFEPTPTTVPGARTIDTAELSRMLQSRPETLLIDLGSGAAVPSGAVWEDEEARTGDDLAFIESAMRHAAGKPGRPLVVMSDGVYGAASYNAVLRLVSSGQPVLWYRGGEEAWAGAQLPAADRRG